MPKLSTIVQKTLKTAGISTVGLALAYGCLLYASVDTAEHSPKIESQNRLETLLEEEKRKLKCSVANFPLSLEL